MKDLIGLLILPIALVIVAGMLIVLQVKYVIGGIR